MTTAPNYEDEHLARLRKLMDRGETLDSRQALFNALEPRSRVAKPELKTDDFTLGFDTNAAFRVGLNGSRGDGALDYLRVRHRGPLVMPGQVLQELWNNSVEGLDPKAKKISKALENLNNEVSAIGLSLGPQGEAVETAVADLLASHADWIDPQARTIFERTMEVFLARAVVAHVPRSLFHPIAVARHNTKTPPGFRDDLNNNGDFFVWADFLLGAMRTLTATTEAVIFVTNETKKDWSRNGVIHPLLMAEASLVVDRPFFMLSVDEFHSFVAARA